MATESEVRPRRPLFWGAALLTVIGIALLVWANPITSATRVERDVVIGLAGVLIGTLSLVFDELTTRLPERRDAARTIEEQRNAIESLQSQLRTMSELDDTRRSDKQRSALLLAQMLAQGVMQSVNADDDRVDPAKIANLCSNLGIHLSDREVEELTAALTAGSRDSSVALYKTFSRKVEYALDKDLLGAFVLGQTTFALVGLLSSSCDADELSQTLPQVQQRLNSVLGTPLASDVRDYAGGAVEEMRTYQTSADAEDVKLRRLRDRLIALQGELFNRKGPPGKAVVGPSQ